MRILSLLSRTLEQQALKDAAFFMLFWGGYAGWLALFAWMAWKGRVRPLLVLGSAMLLGFAASYAFVQRAIVAPTYGHSSDMGYGMLILFAAAVLLVPLAVAAIVYPIGRLWAR